MVSVNEMVDMIEDISAEDQEAPSRLKRNYNLDAPQGVRGRNSDNTLIKEVLNWEPSVTLADGLRMTYSWIKEQINRSERGEHVVD